MEHTNQHHLIEIVGNLEYSNYSSFYIPTGVIVVLTAYGIILVQQ
jgi:hypothetical protein